MSSSEKLLVNSVNERNSRSFFSTVSQHLPLPEYADILEIGAGRGALSFLLHQQYAKANLTITDYDPSQLEGANKYFAERLGTIPPNIALTTADALDLTFGDGTFDTVFAMNVLHHTEKHEWHFKNIPSALDEIRRVLKEEGLFVYSETFKKREIRNYLSQAGFEEVRARRRWGITDVCAYRKTGRQMGAGSQ